MPQFRDIARASESLGRLTPLLPEGISSLLAACPDPDQALSYLDRLQQEQPAAFGRILALPAALHVMVAVFANSRFLGEAVVARPEWLEQLLVSGELYRPIHADEYRERLEAVLQNRGQTPLSPRGQSSLSPVLPPVSPLTLALFRRRQLLRIVARDAMGLASVPDITEDLSHIADAVLEVTCHRICSELAARHGSPEGCAFTILSLGKLGGLELNYSSDIDLLFLYTRNGMTAGAAPITFKEFYQKLANHLTDLLSTYTPAGIGYRVDLRLRPDGRFGEVAVSLDGAKAYYRERARDWELQMLIKARISAGDRDLGAAFLDFVEPLIYSSTLDFSVVEAASETRARIGEKLAARRSPQGFDIKLAPGGIRDIEFLVQCLQRLHGGRERWVRHGGTLLALSRLHDKDLLSPAEYSRLAAAYQFLRNLEHRLQFQDDLQTHSLPRDPDELAVFAQKLPAPKVCDAQTADSFLAELHGHLAGVQEIYERVIHAQKPMYYSRPEAAPEASAPRYEEPAAEEARTGDAEPASNLVRFLDQRAPRLAAAVARANLRRGRVHFEHFLERVLPAPRHLELLEADPTLAGYALDLFEHSPYFSEQLIRTPELVEELERVRLRAGAGEFPAMAAAIDDPAELRRAFRREMFRIQAASICQGADIFATLEETSDLADAVISATYRAAVERVRAARPSARSGYEPRDQMMVITMGRLGMREFDLGSDADLIFVLPDADAGELAFWTRVAERIIAVLTAYTGEGTILSVDTRLRPNGREGPLVQTEAAYKNYFESRAEAWEGITYMKCRAVAGNLDRGTGFLNELQQVDWRRYGQSGRSRKQLAQMRVRLEKEQGGEDPLKAGYGGYYDIDFALMYLRLKAAGFFFKVLNTPARIDIIERMGHLERPDADFLRDAATFYRAVDHGVRVSTGHAEGRMPTGGWQLEILEALVRRWTPDHLHDQPLETELAQIRDRTREFFERLFKG